MSKKACFYISHLTVSHVIYFSMYNKHISPLEFLRAFNGFWKLWFFYFVLGFSGMYYHASQSLLLKALGFGVFLIPYIKNTTFLSLATTRSFLGLFFFFSFLFLLSSVAKFRIILFALSKFTAFGETSRYGVFLVFYEGLGTECHWNDGCYKKPWLLNNYVFSSISITISIIIIKRAEQKSLGLAKH